MANTEIKSPNPLGTEAVSKMLPRFAIPAVISMLVNALYNIVDQIFIGQGVGMYGNAATNVAFPVTIVATGLSLLLGIGGASNFNLALGRKQEDKAKRIAGTAYGSMILCGVCLVLLVRLFLEPLILAFGATPKVFPYAIKYVGITTWGIPFFMLTTGGNHLIRSDGSPAYSMASMVSGALINTILDPLFIFVFHWGIEGAALATVIGQVFSAALVIFYLPRYKSIRLRLKDLLPRPGYFLMIARLGAPSCINQLALTVVQVTMNNVLRFYGSTSIYGSDIPLAVVGIVAKVNMIYLSIAIGISQGAQPILGFNYGARKYKRVKQAYLYAASSATVLACLAFLCFQIFPRQIISLFGSGDALYYEFAEKCFRVFMFCTFLTGLQPVTSNLFTSIGQASRGIVLALTRQVLFLIPLLLIFPMIWGLDGFMLAGPISDGAAGITAILMARNVLRSMPADGELPTSLKGR